MNKTLTSAGISARIWLLTSVFLAGGLSCFFFNQHDGTSAIAYFLLIFFVSMLASIPALIGLFMAVPFIRSVDTGWKTKAVMLLFFQFFVTVCYGGIVTFLNPGIFKYGNKHLAYAFFIPLTLFACGFCAFLFSLKRLAFFFSDYGVNPQTMPDALALFFFKTKTPPDMEQSPMQAPLPTHSNRLPVKGLVTGGFILLMWIPTIFIQNLVSEREQRHKEVVKEVSSGWAASQTLSGPFLTVPYIEKFAGTESKPFILKKQLIITADKLLMNGKINPEERPRSIYKVLLYRADLNFSGNFLPQWPADIDTSKLDLANAHLCFALSDFKGIEEEISVTLNNQKILLNPGLPLNDLGETGLSARVDISALSLKTGISFNMQLKLKGSEQLHFIPMSANSTYYLSAAWPDPSFDGNSLPSARTVKDSGFSAQWNFNRANLLFGSVIKEGSYNGGSSAFGVSLLQPSDQYSKTMRSVKYSILLIGLSFALFFIIEIMQKKPLHLVQYVLVGLALVIFYTLLLSISEFILFDYAYLIAAAATVLLITLYAKAHFGSWPSALIFTAALTLLYGFVFILIRLEDTALLAGSIGLFVILALVMYASRKISWYGNIEY